MNAELPRRLGRSLLVTIRPRTISHGQVLHARLHNRQIQPDFQVLAAGLGEMVEAVMVHLTYQQQGSGGGAGEHMCMSPMIATTTKP